MKIFLKELKEGKTPFFYELKGNESEKLFENSEIKRVSLNVSGWIQKKGVEYVFYISADGEGFLVCSRCLKEFRIPIKEDFTYNILLGKDPSLLKRDYNFTDKDVSTIYVENYELDSLPLLRETVLLSLPLKPLCSENCKGLCPVCGVDRNKKDCGHKVGGARSPFSVLLEEFKSKGSSPKDKTK
ncbi:MAG: DUF177 domain-containing protein [Candidatus Hydrothermales bacterium]